jgi:tetratricopeptide (TPR) repeat protein
MKWGFGIALMALSCTMAASRLPAQAPGDGAAAGQNKTDGNAQKPAETPAPQQAKPQGESNPFPEDTSTVPVMPNKITPDAVPTGTFGDAEGDSARLPGDDLDPVRSPDAEGAAGLSSDPAQESSSNVGNLDSLLPGPGDDETGRRRKKGADLEGAPKETAQQDISVGKYYLDNKNWRAALSRFQSALVLAPEEPEVYWGLAESARHLGNFADARTNYLKVVEYDPGSRHAKEAEKALKEPEIANARAAGGK